MQQIKNKFSILNRDHSFSTYAKFPKNLIYVTPWYADLPVSIGGKKW